MRTFLNSLILLALCVASVLAASAEDLKAKYIGQGGCSADLRSGSVNAIWLDRKQNATLVQVKLPQGHVLMIVQYKDEADQCGTVKDVVASGDPLDSFEFECTNKRNQAAVVVGTWPAKNKAFSGTAVQAWRVEVAQLKFVPIAGPVRCVRSSYSGPDKGEDLVMWAGRRPKALCTKPKKR